MFKNAKFSLIFSICLYLLSFPCLEKVVSRVAEEPVVVMSYALISHNRSQRTCYQLEEKGERDRGGEVVDRAKSRGKTSSRFVPQNNASFYNHRALRLKQQEKLKSVEMITYRNG